MSGNQCVLAQASYQIEQKTLEIIGRASQFNRWMFCAVSPYLRGRILEIGSGIGNISTLLQAKGFQITLSDVRPDYVEALQQKFKGDVEEVIECDIADVQLDQRFQAAYMKYDCVLAVNVIEHIERDDQVFCNMAKLLSPGGQCIILVPAFPWLYCQLDAALNHKRRYNTSRLEWLARQSGMWVRESFYFNAAGMFAWLFIGKLAGQKSITARQMYWYDTLVPLFSWIDRLVGRKIGLSLVVVLEKSTVHSEARDPEALQKMHQAYP